MTQTTSGLVVPELLRLRAEHHPDQVVINVDGSATLTYADWHRRATGLAHGLRARGVTRGARIGLLFGGLDWIDYAIAYLGVVSAGATAVHLYAATDPGELLRRVTECEVTGMVVGHEVTVPGVFSGWRAGIAELDTGDTTPIDAGIRADDLADILYTSGTTGPAKPISTPHGNLSFGRASEGLRQLGDPERLLVPIPLGTTSSATTISIALTMAATMVLCRVDDVERMAELIEQYSISSVMLTPWIGIQMAIAKIHERHDLSRVRTIATTSAPLPPGIATALLRMMPNAELTSVYAAREAVPAVVVTTYDPSRPLCVGRPAQGTDLLIVGEDGNPVRTGHIGEIWLRSAAPKRLFLDGRERAGLVQDEWTRTRDLGYLGDDGDLYLFDRDSDAIRTPAGLVSTIEVEAALYDHPAVDQATVVGIGDRDQGQDVVAFLVLADHQALPAVRAYAAEVLMPHQRPSRYELVDSFPRGIMGKVLKHELRRSLTAALL